MADLVTPMALRAAAEMRLADVLEKGPVGVREIAGATGADTRALNKLLDHLVALEIAHEDEEGRYRLAGLGEPLLTRHGPAGVRARLDPSHVSGRTELALVGLLHTLRTGAPAYEAVHGDNLWNDLEGEAGELDGVADLAHIDAAFDADSVVGAPEWRHAKTVVDVGGNGGALLQRLLEAHPHLYGTLLDLERSAEAARVRFDRTGLRERTEAVPASFFDPLPEGRDVYLLSAVLADWDDTDAVRILRRCTEAAGESGLVMVAEVHMAPPPSLGPVARSRTALWLEASMAHPDRTVEDIRELAARAGAEVLRSGPHTEHRSVLVLRAKR